MEKTTWENEKSHWEKQRNVLNFAQANGWEGVDGNYIPSVAGTYSWEVAVQSAEKFLMEKGLKVLTPSTTPATLQE